MNIRIIEAGGEGLRWNADEILMHEVVEGFALLHMTFEFEHVIDFGRGPALTLEVFQLEAARTIDVVLKATLAEDEIVREIHRKILRDF